jgi:hypothetical protein
VEMRGECHTEDCGMSSGHCAEHALAVAGKHLLATVQQLANLHRGAREGGGQEDAWG